MRDLPPALASEQQKVLFLHAHADGELDPVNDLAVKHQIEADPVLSAELARIKALQLALREHFPPEKVSQELVARINAGLPLVRKWPRPTWAAMAASILLAVALSSGSTWWSLRTAPSTSTVEQIVDGHLRALLTQQTTEVKSSESHTVKPWFNGRSTQAPRVIDLTEQGYRLIGGRLDVIEATPVPTLVYSRRLHVISLTAVASANGSKAPQLVGSVKGYNVVSWSDNQNIYWAASDLNADELQLFGRLFQGASG